MKDLTREERTRTLELLDELKAQMQEVLELPDGYGFRYIMGPQMFRQVAEFVVYEHRCCPFFAFNLIAEREGGDMWLKLTGREGMKSFIREEFDLK